MDDEVAKLKIMVARSMHAPFGTGGDDFSSATDRPRFAAGSDATPEQGDGGDGEQETEHGDRDQQRAQLAIFAAPTVRISLRYLVCN